MRFPAKCYTGLAEQYIERFFKKLSHFFIFNTVKKLFEDPSFTNTGRLWSSSVVQRCVLKNSGSQQRLSWSYQGSICKRDGRWLIQAADPRGQKQVAVAVLEFCASCSTQHWPLLCPSSQRNLSLSLILCPCQTGSSPYTTLSIHYPFTNACQKQWGMANY